MNENKIIMDCHNIARGMSPKKSGNLRNNAIRITNRTSNGFKITYSGVDANYIAFVEDGTQYQDAQKFIYRTWLHLVGYLNSVCNGENNPHKYASKTYKMIGEKELLTENTNYRRAVHRQSIYQHYATQGMTNSDGTERLYRRRGE